MEIVPQRRVRAYEDFGSKGLNKERVYRGNPSIESNTMSKKRNPDNTIRLLIRDFDEILVNRSFVSRSEAYKYIRQNLEITPSEFKKLDKSGFLGFPDVPEGLTVRLVYMSKVTSAKSNPKKGRSNPWISFGVWGQGDAWHELEQGYYRPSQMDAVFERIARERNIDSDDIYARVLDRDTGEVGEDYYSGYDPRVESNPIRSCVGCGGKIAGAVTVGNCSKCGTYNAKSNPSQDSRITLTNDFHGTEAVIIPQPITTGRFRGRHYISRKTALRVRRELCGMPTCQCGGTFSERGGRSFDIVTEDHKGNYIVDV